MSDAVRAVIFDVYQTILEVLPPPADAEARWETLWRETLGGFIHFLVMLRKAR